MPSSTSKSSTAPAGRDKIPPQWRWHYRALVTLAEKAVQQSKEHRREAAADFERPDFKDISSDTSENDVLFAELQSEEFMLTEIDAALQRIRSGTYGVCEATGRTIEPERLRALPWTRFCRDAAERREQR
jgi:RNA polymerase-binding transcription factor DksA